MRKNSQQAAPAVSRSSKGFALLELIVGTALVFTSIGAIVSLTLKHNKLRKLDSELNLALVACRSNLESLRTIDIASLAALNGTGFDVLDLNGNAGGLNPVSGDVDGLPGEWVVKLDKSSGGTKLYLVTARVVWTGVMTRQTFQLKTLIGERK